MEEAAVAAPLRAVPLADEGDADDDRRGCEVAWLPSPSTQPESGWADLMRDAMAAVLPELPNDGHEGGGEGSWPRAAAAEDLHVVR